MAWLPTLTLLAHLVGDYVLQSHVMATRKLASWRWAAIHAAVYSIPFALLLSLAAPTRALPALLVVGGTHAVIDRLGVARRWCQWYGVGHPGLWAAKEGFEGPPPHIGAWLGIIVDNTFHLLINAAAVAWAVA